MKIMMIKVMVDRIVAKIAAPKYPIDPAEAKLPNAGPIIKATAIDAPKMPKTLVRSSSVVTSAR